MTVAAAVSALMAWNAGEIGSLGTLVCFGNGTIAAWGFWTVDILTVLLLKFASNTLIDVVCGLL